MAALRLMLEALVQNAGENMPLLQEQLRQRNWEELKELAHKLYPSFKQLKAEKAALLLRRLELEEASFEQRSEWLSSLQQEVEQVLEFLEESLKQLEVPASS